MNLLRSNGSNRSAERWKKIKYRRFFRAFAFSFPPLRRAGAPSRCLFCALEARKCMLTNSYAHGFEMRGGPRARKKPARKGRNRSIDTLSAYKLGDTRGFSVRKSLGEGESDQFSPLDREARNVTSRVGEASLLPAKPTETREGRRGSRLALSMA